MKKVFHFFDRLEDRVRENLSRRPLIYSILGGTAIILFWRGIWHMVDEAEQLLHMTRFEGALLSFSLGACILLLTGLFTSFFVGDAILISGIKREKKLIEKTEDEVDHEVNVLKHLEGEIGREEIALNDIRKQLTELTHVVKGLADKK